MLQLKSTAGLAPHFFYLASRTGMDSWGGGSLHLHYLMAQVTVFPVGFSSALQNEGLHTAGAACVHPLRLCAGCLAHSGSVWLRKTGWPLI